MDLDQEEIKLIEEIYSKYYHTHKVSVLDIRDILLLIEFENTNKIQSNISFNATYWFFMNQLVDNIETDKWKIDLHCLTRAYVATKERDLLTQRQMDDEWFKLIKRFKDLQQHHGYQSQSVSSDAIKEIWLKNKNAVDGIVASAKMIIDFYNL